MKIPNEVLDVLQRSEITASIVKLPEGQLDRSLYEKVNKVLKNAGGRWNRGQQAHVFPHDPRPRLGLVIEKGESISDQKRFQAFFTPRRIARAMVGSLGIKGCSVLEPSAGHGALADACAEGGALFVTCYDIQAECVAVLKEKGYAAACKDFLKVKPSPVFDFVVMNPPFTKNQDIKHVNHALKFLKPGGVLVAIMAGNTDRKWFSELILDHSIVRLEEGAFRESGTMAKTIVIKIFIP